MKAKLWLAASFLSFSLSVANHAAIVIPGANNGTDGVLNVTADTVIDLSQAVTGVWDAASPTPGKGIYDPTKWAVVFKYSSVTIAAGKTVTFTNHPSRAPVVWLVNGNATIAGTVALDGQSLVAPPNLSEPGPGGFRGANGYFSPGVEGGAGFGVGGGDRFFGGSYGTLGGSNSSPIAAAYGNPSLIPLIGGSGGGARQNQATGGGAGGGALLLVSSGTVNLSGIIRANGGNAGGQFNESGAGSGGGLRIVADTLAGTGNLQALGGVASYAGGLGRIRLERVVNSNSLVVNPDPSVVPLNAGDTVLLWPPAGAPEVRIVSVGGVAAPADPRASFGSAGADVALPQTSSTQVVIETTNVEQASLVQVRLTQRAGGTATVINATYQSNPSPSVFRWLATLPVNAGYSALQVKVVRP